MNVIIYTNTNGNVSVCVPTGEMPIEQVQREHIPKDTQSFIVDISTLPNQDNDFFDAWEQERGVITVNLNKAKAITKTRLRAERAPLLIAQDTAFQRALETNSSTESIIAEKQRLRDITQLADQASSVEQLRSIKV
jgi:hypothetical protein